MLRMAERIGSVAATVAYVALTAYTQVGQAATVVNPLLESSTTAAETVLDLAEAGCDVWGRASREAMETLPRRFAARFRAPSNAGLRPMREQLSRKPWRRNGRTFPARGGG